MLDTVCRFFVIVTLRLPKILCSSDFDAQRCTTLLQLFTHFTPVISLIRCNFCLHTNFLAFAHTKKTSGNCRTHNACFCQTRQFHFGICLYLWFCDESAIPCQFLQLPLLNAAAVKFGKVYVLFLIVFDEGVKHLFNSANDYYLQLSSLFSFRLRR